jgi:hypothetical protein
MRPYRIAQHVYACVSDQGTVFLDAKEERYLGIDSHQSAQLTPLVEGWPGAEGGLIDASDTVLAESLCERGILTRAPNGRALQPHTLQLAQTELILWEHMSPRGLRSHHVLSFLRALLTALFVLKCRSIPVVVRRLERRRRRAERPFDVERSRQLVSFYTFIRMFFFARRARCLLDSIALAEFLTIYGVHPSWIIGVRVRPFSAHSWVQHEHWVLNGTPGFVRHYRPILVI